MPPDRRSGAPAAGPPQPGPSRRGVLRLGLLGGAGALLAPALGGCGLSDVRWDDGEPPAPLVPGPDELARRRAVASASALLTSCTEAATARPDAAAVLGELAEQHSEHLTALGESPADVPTTGPDGPSPEPPAPTPTPIEVPPSRGATPTPGSDPVGDLVTQHTTTAAEAMTDAVGTSGPLARLLSQVAAARAVQARRVAAALGAPVPPAPAAVTPPPSDSTPTASPTTTSAPDASGDEPTGTSTTRSPSGTPAGLLEALAAAVSGEHAARYGYELVATRLEGPERDRAMLAIATHTAAAEQLSGALEDLGQDAPVPAGGYRLPDAVPDATAARALAARLAGSLTALDADLVAAAEGELRVVAVDLVVHRALDAHEWGLAPVALPGA